MIQRVLLSLLLPALLGASADDSFDRSDEVVRYTFELDQDRDYDDYPDDWTRRKGPGFPKYVKTEIDRRRGANGSKQSLRFDANGGGAILYSPLIPVDSFHSYLFTGKLRTQLLKNDVGLVTISLLNAKRERVRRLVSSPVSGTHASWQHQSIGPIFPKDDIRFLVIGCHLIPGKNPDLSGAVWFDELRIGQLPRLSLLNNVTTQYANPNEPINIQVRIGGLDDADPFHGVRRDFERRLARVASATSLLPCQIEHRYDLTLEMHDLKGQTLVKDESQLPKKTTDGIHRVPWTVPPQRHGYYTLHATLFRDGKQLHQSRMSLVVLEKEVAKDDQTGEFGWSFLDGHQELPLEDLPKICQEASVHWVEFPLWGLSNFLKEHSLGEVGQFLQQLRREKITPIGILKHPPHEIRQKFSENWIGLRELFSMPPDFWWPAVEPVLARFSSLVRHWELGDDHSFQKFEPLSETLRTVQQQFDTIGRNTQLGVTWDWNSPPPASLPNFAFLSLQSAQPDSITAFQNALKPYARYRDSTRLRIQPLSRKQVSIEEQGGDLIKRMTIAKAASVKGVFLRSVIDPHRGILNADGSPTTLFLPWRITALSLRETKFLGSFSLPGGSENYVFGRGKEAIMVIWNSEPTVEELVLGAEVEIVDLWGRTQPKTQDQKTKLNVGPTPLIVRNCSRSLAEFRLGVQYELGKLPSQYGSQPDALKFKNSYGVGLAGKVTLSFPREWEIEPESAEFQIANGKEFRLPLLVTPPSNVSLGIHDTRISFELQADRIYQIEVYRPYRIGIGEIEIQMKESYLADGRLQLEQIIINKTNPAETLNMRCSLYIPGRKRQRRVITQLATGEDRKIYLVTNPEDLAGKELWLRIEQLDGRRVLNYRWKLGDTNRP